MNAERNRQVKHYNEMNHKQIIERYSTACVEKYKSRKVEKKEKKN